MRAVDQDTPQADPFAPAEQLDEPLPPGSVRIAQGPFTDRVRLEHLKLAGGALRGEARASVDVSELLALTVRAGFYDAQGRLVGEARKRWTDQHSIHDEGVRFALKPSRSEGKVASAVISIPDYVPE